MELDQAAPLSLSLNEIPADRRFVDELASEGLIAQAARDQALNILYPKKLWGLWVSRLLLATGACLVLAGIVYFFAFNWDKLGAFARFGTLEAGLGICLFTAWRVGLESLSGKIWLLSASVLVGVFLAVFGQIYQTGADSYHLFITWSFLILGWVVLARFAALWAMWLAIANVGLFLIWDQVALPSHDGEMLIYPLVAAFNLTFLGAREWLVLGQAKWLGAAWTRVILLVPILVNLLIPTLCFIFAKEYGFFFGGATTSMKLGALLSVVAHVALLLVYRYKIPDIWSVSTVSLSACLIFEAVGIRVIDELFPHAALAVELLTIGLMTIGLFSSAIVTLRRLDKTMGGRDVV